MWRLIYSERKGRERERKEEKGREREREKRRNGNIIESKKEGKEIGRKRW